MIAGLSLTGEITIWDMLALILSTCTIGYLLGLHYRKPVVEDDRPNHGVALTPDEWRKLRDEHYAAHKALTRDLNHRLSFSARRLETEAMFPENRDDRD